MTIFFPDVSSYQAGLRIQPGTVAVLIGPSIDLKHALTAGRVQIRF